MHWGWAHSGLSRGELKGASQLGKAVIQGLHGHCMAGVALGAARLLQQGCRPSQHNERLVQVPPCTRIARQMLAEHALGPLMQVCTVIFREQERLEQRWWLEGTEL